MIGSMFEYMIIFFFQIQIFSAKFPPPQQLWFLAIVSEFIQIDFFSLWI